jgi:hypothetical protein
MHRYARDTVVRPEVGVPLFPRGDPARHETPKLPFATSQICRQPRASERPECDSGTRNAQVNANATTQKRTLFHVVPHGGRKVRKSSLIIEV